ncbi:hypothetical protein [Streptomyces gossypii]|nr:hypothetical protein [Streptomyces gossypii]
MPHPPVGHRADWLLAAFGDAGIALSVGEALAAGRRLKSPRTAL